MGTRKLVRSVEATLGARLRQAKLPPAFLGPWKHCSSGRESVLCHSIGVGLLAAAVADVDGVEQVAVDVRMRIWSGGKLTKWQPDVVGYRRSESGDFAAVVYADFESPNSSDARVPTKDLSAHANWLAAGGERVPYVLVVCLPEKAAGYWPLKYTRAGYGWNEDHRGQLEAVRSSPRDYWQRAWTAQVEEFGLGLDGVTILNVGDGEVRRMSLSSQL